MPLDPEFVADCPYGPGGILIDEILTVDKEANLVRVRMPTREDLPLTREQRVHPVRHPRHVSGGLMVHMTGVVGMVHAYYVNGLRHAEGWIGYGAHIHDARFRALATIGEPLVLEGKAVQQRRFARRMFIRYRFEFRQGETIVYTGEQSAMWLKIDEASPIAEGPGTT